MAENKLNLQQLKAVNHKTGPLLIIAGAGTGKTTVITKRIHKLITKGFALPSEILALTFTEKAAQEMEERVDKLLPYGYTQMWIMTFHSFCDRVLRDEGLHMGLNTNYSLVTDVDRIALFRRHLFEFELDYFRPLGNPNKFISAILQHFDRLRDEDILPDQYQNWVDSFHPKGQATDSGMLEKQQYQELAKCYKKFQEIKLKQNVLDFSDLISYCLTLFRTRPNVQKTYHQKFKYILVDEFQDTNYAQNVLVNLLVNSSRNITVVADDDQAIYRWRGASVSNVLQFKKTYPKSKIVTLTRNYRSSQNILDASYRLIQNNNPDRLEVKAKIIKKLKSSKSDPGIPPQYLHFDHVENEADGIAKKIKDLIGDSPDSYRPQDIAILVRANAHARMIVKSLDSLGIPNQYLGPAKLFEQPEVKDLIAYLKVIDDSLDIQSLFRVLSMDIFDIPVNELIDLNTHSQKNGLSFFKACESSNNEKILKVIDLIKSHVVRSPKESAGTLLFDFLEKTGLLSTILNLSGTMNETKADNIIKFFNRLKGFEPDISLSLTRSVLEWIDLSSEVGESPLISGADLTQSDSVKLLTIHSAKGLEFPVVFLTNLVMGRFPSIEKKEPIPIPLALAKEVLPQGDFHLQEERRLFYVGMTRAQQLLIMTSASYYGDAKRVKKPSLFLHESLGNQATDPLNHIATQPSLLDWQPAQFSFHNHPSPSQSKAKIDYLSYSQIQTFKDCPLHYKAKYILKLSSPPSAASSFGNTIHKTLRDYYLNKKQNPKIDILDIYAQNWTPQGYLNPKHSSDYFDKGKKYLTQYLQVNRNEVQPTLMEESFMVPVGSLKIGGKIDRVDVLPGGQIEIIDYKTSTKSLTPKQASTDLQLSFYALAANLLKQSPFNKQPSDIKLSLYYFEDQQKVSVFQSAEQLESAKKEILQAALEIESSDFRCSGDFICQGICDYRILCDLDRKN